MSKRGKVLRVYETRAVFENLETGNCVLASQLKEGTARELQVCDRIQLPDLGVPAQITPLEAIFGIYDFLSGSYVALVVESESYVSVGNIVIRKAKKIIIVPLFRNGKLLSETKQRDEDRYLQLLHLAFSEHSFFFSTTYDMTLTQQQQAQLTSKQLSEPLWFRANHKFFWNREAVIDLITCEADQWLVPFMSSYVEVRPECEVEGLKFTLLFISRRSRYRQGCRFTKRGLDDQGHAANFVETEQILLFPDGKVTAYVQIRGSIPLKWCSPVLMKYDPIVYIDENRHVSEDRAEKHVRDIVQRYADNMGSASVVFINLIDNKGDQGKLGAAFKEVVDAIQPKVQHELHFVSFDFHHECKQKGKWNNLSKLVAQVDPFFRSQGYFCRVNGVVTSWQVGVIRTNCMDNLDRTNVVQSLFARRSLILQLGQTHLLAPTSPSKTTTPLSVLETPWKNFEKIYKTVWANNADAMSVAYAGTGALKVDFTKTGKRTFKGMFNDGVNACVRYYINNLTDGAKQDGIDLLLGFYKPDPSAPSPFVPRPDQETLGDNLTKAFVLMLIIFSSMLLLSPSITGFSGSAHADTLCTNFVLSFGITFLIVVFILYKVMKEGSPIGERIVRHPQLLPEPPKLLLALKTKKE